MNQPGSRRQPGMVRRSHAVAKRCLAQAFQAALQREFIGEGVEHTRKRAEQGRAEQEQDGVREQTQ